VPHQPNAYRQYLTDAGKLRQRWLLLGGGLAYAVISMWAAFRIGAPPAFAVATFQFIGVTLVLFGFTFARTPGPLLEFNPSLFNLAVGAHILMGAAAAPADSALRSALPFSLLIFFSVLLAPTLRAALAAMAVVALVGGAGALIYVPGISAVETLGYLVFPLAIAGVAAWFWEQERRAAFDLRTELARRATSDTMTGVSNRAHITLLARNEFARARRYREPFACLMIEIDHFDALAATAPRTAEVVVQVFTGYCVVMMRHCDSFGRLTPSRFLALLPETQAAGADILSRRMCRDLAALDVMVDGNAVNFTVSIGAAQLHAGDRSAVDLLRRAEQGLEDAIEQGRNGAVFAAPPLPLAEDMAEDIAENGTA
jgi:diguanylate cyclase (GGDEF)-like protein